MVMKTQKINKTVSKMMMKSTVLSVAVCCPCCGMKNKSNYKVCKCGSISPMARMGLL